MSVMRPALVFSPALLLQFFELGSLRVGQQWRESLIGFSGDLVHFCAGICPNFLQLLGGMIENRIHLRHLFRREVELGRDPIAHPFGEVVRMTPELSMPIARLMKSDKPANRATGQKGEDETCDELSFQRSVHGSKMLPIAESAMAYSSVSGAVA